MKIIIDGTKELNVAPNTAKFVIIQGETTLQAAVEQYIEIEGPHDTVALTTDDGEVVWQLTGVRINGINFRDGDANYGIELETNSIEDKANAYDILTGEVK